MVDGTLQCTVSACLPLLFSITVIISAFGSSPTTVSILHLLAWINEHVIRGIGSSSSTHGLLKLHWQNANYTFHQLLFSPPFCIDVEAPLVCYNKQPISKCR